MNRQKLSLGERIADFSLKTGILTVLGVVAYFGAKQTYDVTLAASSVDTLAELEPTFMGMVRGIGQFAVATAAGCAVAARISKVKDLVRARTETAEQAIVFETIQDEAEIRAEQASDYELEEAPVPGRYNPLTDTLHDLEPIRAY